MSVSLWPHGLQHARLPCPSPTPGVYPNSCSLELMMPSNHLILCCPLLLLPSIFPSIKVFSNKPAVSIRWPKYWTFSFIMSLSNEYSGLISFRNNWFDLFAVQRTLKSLLQHYRWYICDQSCLTLCEPMDCSPPGSGVPGILQARTLNLVAIFFSNGWKWKVKSENEVVQLCPTLRDLMDCSLPGSSVHGIFQARVLEWGAIAFSRARH